MAQLKTGDPAPEFEATDDAGNTVRLQDLRGKRVVLYFYPKDDTPGCTTQACGFRDLYPDITGKQGMVLGVSPDNARAHGKFKTKYNLPFPLLVDPEHKIADEYGVWQKKKFMGREFMGIVRSHFVIDEQGTLANVKYNVKAAESPKLAVNALG
jgi:peroxiredoxin Q/BCP